MKLKDLTIEQVKAVEKVIYMGHLVFEDSDFFEFMSLMITESWEEDAEVSFSEDDATLFIEDEITWFEAEKFNRGLEW